MFKKKKYLPEEQASAVREIIVRTISNILMGVILQLIVPHLNTCLSRSVIVRDLLPGSVVCLWLDVIEMLPFVDLFAHDLQDLGVCRPS